MKRITRGDYHRHIWWLEENNEELISWEQYTHMRQKGLPMGDDTDKTIKIIAWSMGMIVILSILLLYFIVTTNKNSNMPPYMGTPMSEELWRKDQYGPYEYEKPQSTPNQPAKKQMDRALERCMRRGIDSCILELDSSASMRKHLV